MQEKRSEDRRKYVRLNLTTEVSFRVIDEGTAGVFKGEASGVSKNVSVEGICFSSERQLEPGTKLELKIKLPSESEPLLLRGEVRWARALESPVNARAMFDTGVKLHIVKESDENRYLKYINQKMVEGLSQYLHL